MVGVGGDDSGGGDYGEWCGVVISVEVVWW